MFDDEHCDLGGKLGNDVEDDRAFSGGHAGGGFVQQQHRWLQSERDGDLDQSLLAVGQRLHRGQRVIGDPQLLQQCIGVLQRRPVRGDGTQHVAADALSLTDRECNILQHRQAAKQRVDLESTPESSAHACGLRQCGDVIAIQQDTPRGRCETAGDQVDERRLAGTVRTDQGVACARFQAEVDVVCNDQRAEPLVQAGGFQCGSQRNLRIALSIRPSNPPRANITISTSRRPIQKYQNSGCSFASVSCAIM